MDRFSSPGFSKYDNHFFFHSYHVDLCPMRLSFADDYKTYILFTLSKKAFNSSKFVVLNDGSNTKGNDKYTNKSIELNLP
jgi:hypothetical protein